MTRIARRGIVLTLLAAIVVALAPLGAQGAYGQAEPPAGAARTGPPAGPFPATDATPPADHPVPRATGATPDPATVGPPPGALPSARAGEELVERRTATSKTFATERPDELRTEIYDGPVHYRDGQGRWVPIDATLRPSKDGRRHNTANAFDLSFADSAGNAAVARMAFDGLSVGFALDGAAKVTGKSDGRSVTYAHVRKDTDLRLSSRSSGLKEELVLASRAAPDRFVFPLELKGLTASLDADGNVIYRDGAGVERARTPHGFMIDGRIDPRSGEGEMSLGVTYALIPWKGGTALEVRLDRAWLDDPARQYPVTVDPEIHHAAFGDDTYVMSGFYRDNSYDAELKVGTYDGGAHIGRSFVRFDTSPINGASVQRAEVHAAERHSWDCSYWPEPAYRVTGGWNGRAMPDWSNQPPVDPNWVGGTWSGTACGSRTAVWNVTGFAAHWAANPSQSWGVSLRATNEGNNSMYKKYASTEAGAPPALHVWYNPPNRPPATPAFVRPGAGERPVTSSNTASAVYSDPDGSPGAVAFWLYNYAGQVIWGDWSPVVCSGCTAAKAIPAQPDGWYYLRAIAQDGVLASAWSPEGQWFFVDTRAPNPPSSLTPAAGAVIASPARASAVYSEPYGWAGSMYFWLVDGAGRILKEGWDDATLVGRPTANGGTATFALPPLAVGAYSVYAMAYDGLLSSQVGPNRFNVAAAPGAPSNLNATPGPESAQIKWTPAPPNGGAVTRYDFTAYDGTDTAAAPIQRRCENPCSPGDGFVFGGLIAGHSYTFRAKATNVAGTGPESAPSNAVTTHAWGPYGAQPTATPLDKSAKVEWRPELLATSYRVRTYRGSRPVDGRPRPQDFVSQTEVFAASSTTITGLRNGSSYYFTITPVYLLLLVGPESTVSNETVPFGRPFAPVAPGVQEGDSVATLTWRAPEAQADGTPGDNGRAITSYTARLFREGGELVRDTPVAGTTTTLRVDGLLNGTRYYFTVAATNEAGASDVATSGLFSPFGAPFAPVDVAAFGGSRSATVNWQAPPPQGAQGEIPGDNGRPITGYRVLVDPPCSPGPCPGSTGISGSANTTQVTGLAPGADYSFRVVAVNERGTGAPSSSATTKTFVEPPSAPTGLTAVERDARVVLSWTPPSVLNGSTITGYDVVVSPDCTCTGIHVTDPAARTTTVGGLVNGTVYQFQVRATSAAGPGALSSPVGATPRLPLYAALGDSYSSGVGADANAIGGAENEMCQRKDQAYGPVYRRLQQAPSDFVFLACGGAVTGDPRSTQDSSSLAPIQKVLGNGGQLSRLPTNADLVTLTIGGNDVGFSSVLTDCFRPDEIEGCDVKHSSASSNKEAEINALGAILEDLYRAILAKAPGARVVVLTYPQIITESDNCIEQDVLSDNEKKWIRLRTAQLANVAKEAITRIGDPRLIPLDEIDAFTGHTVCNKDKPFVNGVGTNDRPGWFHPTIDGYNKEAQDLLAKVGRIVP